MVDHHASIITLGCKVNQAESETLADLLPFTCTNSTNAAIAAGDSAPYPVIINTCAVTSKAAMQSRQAIRRAIRAHAGRNATIVVTGCYASIAAKQLQDIKGVDMVAPHDEIVARLADLKNNRQNSKTEADAGAAAPAPAPAPAAALTDIRQDKKRARPFLKIQDGCNSRCTYCVVPHARGKSRSVSPEQVMTALQRFADSGYHEVVLCGIHLGAYGKDLSPPTNLHTLLTKIVQTQPIPRIRLSSIEPKEVSDDLIALVAASPGICDHFHVPLQSGDDAILAAMGRPYRADFFENVIDKIRTALPDAAIGTDVMVGFANESDSAFSRTEALLKRLPLTYLHVFPFSPREKTVAFDRYVRMAPEILADRSRRLRTLGHDKSDRFYRSQAGRVAIAVVESTYDEKSAMHKAITGNYIPIWASVADTLINQPVRLRIHRVDADSRVYGSIDSGEIK